jgi:hypothetical protein
MRVRRRRRRGRRLLASAFCTAMLAGAVGAALPAGAAVPGPPIYVALGGSGSVGVQPTPAVPHGQRTHDGYANDLLESAGSHRDTLKLVQLGCPGETTATMLAGGGHCAYAAGSQLAAALAFLHQHPSTVLVTLDLGFNNLVHCISGDAINAPCIDLGLASVRTQLPQILAALRGVGGRSLHIVGVNHYDPYLGAYLEGPAGQSFARQSLDVIARLNATLRSVYAGAGLPVADVAAAFDISGTSPTPLAGAGVVPRDVARTCQLTWACTPAPLGPNPHPNDAGYEAIRAAIRAVVPAL